MPGIPTPFHQQAEDIGRFLVEDRARDARRNHRDDVPQGPSENTD